MFADFRGATRGTGKSFKGALDYFLNDKGLGDERPTTDERVDVLELRNLATDNPRHAWFEMMSTAQASDALKEAAGIKKGGRAGEKPVFTYHLAWHDSERPERAAMLDAARSTLKLLGLEDHQALIVAHTDTAHPHVHVIVNRVNPDDGRYAGLSNSWKALKGWAIDYSKEHGTTWHIPLEQAKEAHAARRQTVRQSGFNRTAEGKPPLEPKPAAPKKAADRAEWQGRKTAANQNNTAEAEAAAVLKANLAAKWSAFRQFQQLKTAEQQAEKSTLWVDRKAARDAIYEKYAEANKAVWSAERPKPAPEFRPSPLSETTRSRLSKQRRKFERQEETLLGCLANAAMLAKGKSVFAIIHLALNANERRRLFDLAQRRTATQGRQAAEQKVRAAWVPETRRMQSDRLKVMRTAELAQFDRVTAMLRQQMAEQHQVQAHTMAAMKAALSATGKEAWADHAARFRPDATRTAREQPGRVDAPREQPSAIPQRPQEAAQDRFGRSRDRKPRQPRAERQERTDKADTAAGAETARQQGRDDRDAAAPFNQAAKPAPQANQEEFTPEELRRTEQIKARWQAEREANERGEDRGLERGR